MIKEGTFRLSLLFAFFSIEQFNFSLERKYYSLTLLLYALVLDMLSERKFSPILRMYKHNLPSL